MGFIIECGLAPKGAVHPTVACRDKAHASTLFSMLRANALVFGTSSQRVASCFVQGLSERFAMVQPLGAVGFIGPSAKTIDAT